MVTDPENIKVEEIKQEYLKEMRILLNDFAFELHAFEDLWAAGKLREAYVAVDKAIQTHQLVRTQKNRKADEDFFWTWMH